MGCWMWNIRKKKEQSNTTHKSFRSAQKIRVGNKCYKRENEEAKKHAKIPTAT